MVPPGEADRSEDRVRGALAERFPQALPGLDSYAEILRGRGIEWGLLGPREGDRVWGRHLSNSLALSDVIASGLDVADVGSGAGLPGLPLALVRPDLRVTLIEPLLRRATFLELAVEELALGERVTVLRARAEEVKEVFDVVTCRAVASLEKLVRWTTPLFLPEGELLALKGVSAEEEIEAASTLLRKRGLVAEVLEIRAAAMTEGTRAVLVRSA
ncbi:16S rRNA (guanine(527)-N(7))-methyltransferase RsmG [Arachnia propionica]|uniref:Ribosomal RNA small subunit methyltransferase G n=1 Tax=Arachnia propionica TaxID=1750 RepID=A0A3P1T5H0_9ACTN|nr:16S rRNA (guanine(527)-N(7))-methyltransferase RsmG [Arachnia propionica]RRD04721.1 16S rRNA (guanine(527)-N(7))-methyltransferase RsmG [Arachnia propionica]